MITKRAYKVTGFVVLVLGILFLLRDMGINYIGNTSGWTILIVLVGAALLGSEDLGIKDSIKKGMKMGNPAKKR